MRDIILALVILAAGAVILNEVTHSQRGQRARQLLEDTANDPDKLQNLLDGKPPNDPWGRPLGHRVKERDGHTRVEIFSPGRDGKPDTDDDLSVTVHLDK